MPEFTEFAFNGIPHKIVNKNYYKVNEVADAPFRAVGSTLMISPLVFGSLFLEIATCINISFVLRLNPLVAIFSSGLLLSPFIYQRFSLEFSRDNELHDEFRFVYDTTLTHMNYYCDKVHEQIDPQALGHLGDIF